MNRLLTAAFALSLLGGAAHAQPQPQDDHHHGGPSGHPAAPAAPAAPARSGFQPPGSRPGAGFFQPGLGGAPNRGVQGPPAPQVRGGPALGGQGQGGPAQAFQGQGRPGGGGAPQGYRGSGGPGFRGAPVQGGREWRAPHPVRGRPYYFPRGYGYRAWGFGEYLPDPFISDQYVIYDYYDYGLPQPPPGFEWVRVGPDALLVRPYDGYILDVARGLFF